MKLRPSKERLQRTLRHALWSIDSFYRPELLHPERVYTYEARPPRGFARADVLDRQAAAGLSPDVLADAFIASVGAGGVADPTVLNLARAGTGRIRVIDCALTVEATNLNRCHHKADVGKRKSLWTARRAAEVSGSGATLEAVVSRGEDHLATLEPNEVPSIVIAAVDDEEVRRKLDAWSYSLRGATTLVSVGLSRTAEIGYVAWSRPPRADEPQRGCLRCWLAGFPPPEIQEREQAEDCPAGARPDLCQLASAHAANLVLRLLHGEVPPQARIFHRDAATSDIQWIARRPDCACNHAAVAAPIETPAPTLGQVSSENGRPAEGDWLGPL